MKKPMCVQNIFQPVLIPFPQQENDVVLQQDNASSNDTRSTQNSLQNVRELILLAKSSDQFHIEHGQGMMERHLTRSVRPLTTFVGTRGLE